jgi:hypothetical protein
MTLIGVSTGHSINTVLKLDPCHQRLTLGIESLVFNVSLYDFDWGKYCHCMQSTPVHDGNRLQLIPLWRFGLVIVTGQSV